MNVLLTNDDGIRSPGIHALAQAFAAAGHRVFVCAPDRERSAASHSVTLAVTLHAEPVDFPCAERAWASDGTPSDCASLGLFLARDAGVDLVVSGINRGMNMGGACVYSGTVNAAMEASMCGCQGLAVSLCTEAHRGEDLNDYGPAARLALRVAEWIGAHPLPLGALYSLNVPALPYDGIRGLVPARLAPVFLDPPDYAPAEDGSWRYRGFPRRFDDERYDTVLVDRGFATLTKLTWDWRLDADDGDINEIGL